MTRNRRLIQNRQDVCVEDLINLNITTGVPDYPGDTAHICIEETRTGDFIYIGELCDPRLLALVRKAPKLAEFIHFLHTTAVLDPDYDQEWVEFVAELNEQLGM